MSADANTTRLEDLYFDSLTMTDREKYLAYKNGDFNDVKVYFIASADPLPGYSYDEEGYLIDSKTGKRKSQYVASALKGKIGQIVIDRRFIYPQT